VRRKLRWPDGVRCHYCGASRIHKDGYTDKGAANYHCLNCGNNLTKTIFEHHKFTIEEMFYILEEMEKRRGRKGIKQDRPRKRGLRRRG